MGGIWGVATACTYMLHGCSQILADIAISAALEAVPTEARGLFSGILRESACSLGFLCGTQILLAYQNKDTLSDISLQPLSSKWQSG